MPRITALFLIAYLFLLSGVESSSSDNDKFVGNVKVLWNEGGDNERDMTLLEPFQYIDPRGKTWEAPSGAIINGASIPPIFWQIIGPPFVGNYRRASVLHDYHCEIRTEPWRDVHQMFLEASLASGVEIIKAKLMYLAIMTGGPRWEKDKVRINGVNTEVIRDIKVMMNKDAFDKIEKQIRSNNLSIKDINKMVDDNFKFQIVD